MRRSRYIVIKVLCCCGVLILSSLLSQAYGQKKEIDSVKKIIDDLPQLSQQRFEKTMELARIYRKYQPRQEEIVDGFGEDYLNFGVSALSWAEENGTLEELAQSRRFNFEYALYQNSFVDDRNFDVLFLGQQMIDESSFNSKEDEFYVYRELTDLYQEKEFYKEFLDLNPKKFELARELDKPFSEEFYEYGSIATIHYRLQDYTTARSYWKKTLEVMPIDSLNLHKASITNNIALSFSKEEARDSAVYYYSASLEIIKSKRLEQFGLKGDSDYKHLQNVIESNIAYLGVRTGEYDNALRAIKKELYTGKIKGEPSTIVQAHNKLGEVYYYKKQYSSALKHLDSAKSLFKVGMHDKDQIKNLQQRGKILLATNNQDNAEKLFYAAQKFEDSIARIRSVEQTKVASAIYETQFKEKQLQKQKLELAEQNAEIIRSEKSQIIYGVLVIILLVLLLAFYWLNRKIKTQKKEVEIQKDLVDNSLKEKEILLKEVHHRVKNNLQVVSSLLIKQGAVSDDDKVKKLMEDGQNRIKSMAVVHQLLYQTEGFSRLNLKEYTKLLVSSISSSNQFNSTNITITTHMEDLFSHIDIAVPYGLILNELLSNCFEHGFPHGGPGDITLSVTNVKDDMYLLKVSDTGLGIPDDIEEKMEQSLGVNLIKGLAWQLRGKMSYANTLEGCQFEVQFQNNLKNVS